MHGVKRQPKSSSSAEARAARRAKESSKLQSYLDIERTFFTYKKEARKDLTALHHTTTLLTLNPELYTVWNFRREILLQLFSEQAKEAGDEGQKERNRELLEDDLMLTEHALRANPKVYWIWNHRMWCLTHYPAPTSSTSQNPEGNEDKQWIWNRELKLVEKMLEYDPRNFHGWNCRRAIVHELSLALLPPSLASTLPPFPAVLSHIPAEHRAQLLALAQRELAYTLRKIESNFSNFSAWHQRTKLLPHVWVAQELSQSQIDVQVDEELELIKQAMYTDPADQSVWFYHRWLVDLLSKSEEERRERVLREEAGVIEELFDLEPESKWCALSLAHLYTLLADASGKRGEERGKAKELLEKLIELDPDREARYRDLLDGKAHF